MHTLPWNIVRASWPLLWMALGGLGFQTLALHDPHLAGAWLPVIMAAWLAILGFGSRSLARQRRGRRDGHGRRNPSSSHSHRPPASI